LQASSEATGLIQVLRKPFATFGIPATLTTDEGPEFTAHATKDLLTSWGVHHRTSSAYNPHANNHAETGVNTVKRLIAGNTDLGGTLKSAFFKALLTYKNCQCSDTRMSPAMCLFGRPIRDLLPTLSIQLKQPTQDSTTWHARQIALNTETGTKPDRPPPNQMGQHSHCGRGHTVSSVSFPNGQQRQTNHSQPPIPNVEHHPHPSTRPPPTAAPTPSPATSAAQINSTTSDTTSTNITKHPDATT